MKVGAEGAGMRYHHHVMITDRPRQSDSDSIVKPILKINEENRLSLDASFGTSKLLLRVNTCIAEKPYTLQKCFSNLQGLGCEESRILFTT